MPAASRRSSTSMPWAACLPMMRRRTSGFEACNDTRRGLICCSMMRASSSVERFVKVTNVPARKLRRKSSSRSVRDARMSSGSWRMKQKMQALRHCFTPSNTTPSNSKPQSSPSSRKRSTSPASPSRSMYPTVISSSAESQRQSIRSRTGSPSTVVMKQPGSNPASSAGLSGATYSISARGGSFLRAREPAARALPAASRSMSFEGYTATRAFLSRYVVRRLALECPTPFPKLPALNTPAPWSFNVACSFGNCSMLNENRQRGNNLIQSTQAESGQGHKMLIPDREFPSFASLGVSHS